MATKKEIEIKLKSTLDGKGVEEAKQQIDALNKSTEQLDKGSQQATRSVKNMGQGALQAAYFFDDLAVRHPGHHEQYSRAGDGLRRRRRAGRRDVDCRSGRGEALRMDGKNGRQVGGSRQKNEGA